MFGKFSALPIALLLFGCATPELTNTTPDSTPRVASGVYVLSAEVDPNGTQIAHVNAVLHGVGWPMMPTGSNAYAVAYFADACENTVPYFYTLGYQRRRLIGSGYSSTVHEKRFPEAGGYVLTLTGEPPPDDCPDTIGSTLNVDSTDDTVDAEPGDGNCLTVAGACTLRAAVMEANASAGHHYIVVPAGHYILSLTGSEAVDAPNDAVNDLDITGAMTLIGSRSAARNENLSTFIDANEIDRVFDIYTPADQFVTLAYLRVENGQPIDSGGGAIWNRGNLRMDRVALLNNSIEQNSITYSCGASVSTRICNRGGALFNEGQALVARSTIAHNSTGNTTGRGGGISSLGADAELYLRQSLVTDNNARFNGGLANYLGTVDIINTTFAANRSTTSGTVAAEVGNFDGTVNIRNATFQNSSTLFGNNRGGTISIANSLVNIDTFSRMPFCAGPLDSGGYNVIAGPSDVADYLSGCGYTTNVLDRTDVRISLPGLEHNGGPTRTIALRPRDSGSPFFDPIDFGGLLCPAVDQRQSLRDDRDCDAGAFEE